MPRRAQAWALSAVCRSSCAMSESLISIDARRNGRAFASLTARGGGLPVGVTATLARDLPGMVRQLVEGLALEALGLPVTDTNGSVTDTDSPGEGIPRQPAARGRRGLRQPAPQGRRGGLRQPILEL